MKSIGLFLVLTVGMALTGCLSFLSDSSIVPSNFKKGDSDIWSAVYSKDGMFLFTGDSRRNSIIAKYDARTGKLVKKFDKIKNNGYPNLLLSGDGRSLLVWYNSSLENPDSCIYDTVSGKILYTISKTGRYFAGSDGFRAMNATSLPNRDRKITITDAVTGTTIKEITVPGFSADQVKKWVGHSISNDGRFYSDIGYVHDSDQTFWIIHHVDLEDPNLVTFYLPSDIDYVETLSGITYSPDGKYMAIKFYRSVFPRAEYNTRLAQAKKAGDGVKSSLYSSSIDYERAVNRAISGYGFYLSTDNDKWTYEYRGESVIRVYNLTTREFAGETKGHDLFNFVEFSPDSKSLYGPGMPYSNRTPETTILKGSLGSNGKWQFVNWKPFLDSKGHGGAKGVGKFLCFTPDGKQMIIDDRSGVENIIFVNLE